MRSGTTPKIEINGIIIDCTASKGKNSIIENMYSVRVKFIV